MKALRYLLIAVTVLSVLSLSAQTHQYATTHSQEQSAFTGAYVNPQMPVATMDYRHSDHMTSGSTLPQAAVDGVTTTEDQESSSHHGAIRKGRPGDWDDPYDDPIGDAALPLMLLACAYLGVRIFLKNARKRVRK